MGKCTFSWKWLNDPRYKRLDREFKGDKYSANCCLCNKIIDLGKMGEYALNSHMKSEKHVSLEATVPSTRPIFESFISPTDPGPDKSPVSLQNRQLKFQPNRPAGVCQALHWPQSSNKHIQHHQKGGFLETLEFAVLVDPLTEQFHRKMTEYPRQKYFNALSEGLEDLWRKNSFTDIDVLVDGKTFPCHRVVLGAVSHYFSTMFTSGFKESSQKQVQIQGIDKGTFETVLMFIYTGYDPVTKANVDLLLKASVMLQIRTLQDICENFLHKHIGIENCIGIKRLATMHGMPKLEETSWFFIIGHFPDICKGEEFPNLDVNELLEIIMDQRLYTPSEEYVCDAVLSWFKTNSEQRKVQLEQIFQSLFLVKMPVEYLENLRDGPLKNHQECKLLIDKALDRIHESIRSGDQATLGCQRMEDILCMVGTRSRHPDPQKTEVKCYSSRHDIKFKLAPLPSEPGPCFAVCSHGNDIYISGGYIQQNLLLHFAAETDQWYQHELSTNGRWGHVMASVENSIYLIGGMSKTNETIGCIDRYDPLTKQCVKVADLTKPVSSMTSAVVDKKVYIFGGKLGDRTPTTVIQCFDTVSNTTRIIGDLPISCAGSIGRSVMHEGIIYLVFREGNIVEFRDNAEIKTVCQIDAFDHFGAVLHQGKVLIIGSQSSQFKTFLFDPETKQSSIVPTNFKAPMCNFYCLILSVSKDYLTANISSADN